MADVDDDRFTGLPSQMQHWLDQIGLLDELAEEDAEKMYEPLRTGHCMACGAPLGETTLLFVNHAGVVGGYCGGPCAQDFTVLGWIQEQHQDIIDKLQFRNGQGDSAPGTE